MWDEARSDQLKQYWGKGMSSGQIARAFAAGGDPAFRPTRNAVIGRAHRMGLVGRAPKRKGGRTMSKAQHSAVRRVLTGQEPRPPAIERAPVPPAAPFRLDYRPVGRVTFADLESHHCRYPVGDDPATMMFCGERKQPGISYCADCARVAHVAPKPKTEVKPFAVLRNFDMFERA